jgi:acyl-CoA synthetase (AMP-forming)/AMP-acid ligase II
MPMGPYALAASRHMAEFGTTSEQLAQIAVSARAWAAMNPRARYRDPLTIDEVLTSPMESTPLHRLDCCLVTDGAGAFVLTSAERARGLPKPPVYVLGAGTCHDHSMISQMPDLTTTQGAVSGPAAFAMAGVKPTDVDVLMGYDSVTITALLHLEDLGFCAKGEGGPFVEDGNVGPGGTPLAFSLTLPLAFGATVVLMDGWDAEETLRLVADRGVTHTPMVPTMFHRLLSLPDEVRTAYDVSSLRHVLHGAAPCPVPVKRRMIEWLGPVVMEYYAATEGVGSFVDSSTWLAHPGTVGKPLSAGQVVVGDEDGEPLPTGEVGLVHLKAPAAARFEYYKDEAKTASSFRGEYFTLGDVGYLDDEG